MCVNGNFKLQVWCDFIHGWICVCGCKNHRHNKKARTFLFCKVTILKLSHGRKFHSSFLETVINSISLSVFNFSINFNNKTFIHRDVKHSTENWISTNLFELKWLNVFSLLYHMHIHRIPLMCIYVRIFQHKKTNQIWGTCDG